MFKVGDTLKVQPSIVDRDLQEYKTTTVYKNMVKAAEEYRFEVVGDNGMDYILKRVHDSTQYTSPKAEIHTTMVLVPKQP